MVLAVGILYIFNFCMNSFFLFWVQNESINSIKAAQRLVRLSFHQIHCWVENPYLLPFSVQLSLCCSYSSSQAVSWHRLVDLFITEGVCCRLQSLSSVINVGFVRLPKQIQTGLLKGLLHRGMHRKDILTICHTVRVVWRFSVNV